MEIGAFEAKNRLSELLTKVEGGEEVIITRRGKAVARLVPVHDRIDRTAARRAADEIIARSKGVRLGAITTKELIEDGRR